MQHWTYYNYQFLTIIIFIHSQFKKLKFSQHKSQLNFIMYTMKQYEIKIILKLFFKFFVFLLEINCFLLLFSFYDLIVKSLSIYSTPLSFQHQCEKYKKNLLPSDGWCRCADCMSLSVCSSCWSCNCGLDCSSPKNLVWIKIYIKIKNEIDYIIVF